jgi:hypothetical protein
MGEFNCFDLMGNDKIINLSSFNNSWFDSIIDQIYNFIQFEGSTMKGISMF